ncbi:MAG: hypothetical protein ACW981_15425 [Candidatus Hodarchaeales archaeon]|jgi:DNA-binding HxlR family transcriptional regulator
MAVLPILEQKNSKIVIKTLLEKEKTIKELNEYFINLEYVNISTATLYRRVKELFLAGLIEKRENGSYSVTEHGKTAYNELYGRKKRSKKIQGDYSPIIGKLSGKESYVLNKLQNQQAYTSSLLRDMSISPNYLVKLLANLTQLQLVKIVEVPGKKPGRPKKVYQLTALGKQVLSEIEELKYKLQWKK